MKTVLLLTYASVVCAPLHAAVRYVDVNSANPSPPYLDWSSAAANIQDAIDAAWPGDEIVVTNGVYQTGSRQTPGGSDTNRVVVAKAVTVRSVNGFGVTVIRGEQGDSTRKWSGMRCAYLAEGAVVVGFTLTNGGSVEGGGVYGGTVSNCVLSANTAMYGGGAASCRLVDCLITDNSATDGGGAWNCEVTRCAVIGNQASVGGGLWGPPCAGDDGHGPWGCPPPTTCDGPGQCGLQPGVAFECTIVGNVAGEGGGAYGGWLRDCILTHNNAQREESGADGGGGGVARAALYGCTLRSNRADAGGGAFRAILKGCVVTGNSAVGSFGGGAHLAWLSGCTLSGNTAASGGGGACTSTLENCVLTANAAYEGGGAWGGTLSNCSIVANTASSEGGGVWSRSGTSGASPPAVGCDVGCDDLALASVAAVRNCIVFNNTAPSGANHAGFTGWGTTGEGPGFFGGALNHSCTTPLPTNSFGNITNAPLFVDAASGNFRLQSSSPCINSGRNAFAPAGPDSDGNPRFAGGTVDIGAYELQSPQSIISYAWRQHYLSNLPPFGLGDFDDADGDGQTNWQEWRAGTNPRDAFSVLRLLTPLVTTDGLLVRWQSLSGQSYFLERSTNLGGLAAFTPWASNIVGQADVTIFADTNAVGTSTSFYRIGVHE